MERHSESVDSRDKRAEKSDSSPLLDYVHTQLRSPLLDKQQGSANPSEADEKLKGLGFPALSIAHYDDVTGAGQGSDKSGRQAKVRSSEHVSGADRSAATTGTDRGLDPSVKTPQEIAKYIQAHKTDVDYSKIWGGPETRLMMFGDWGDHQSGKLAEAEFAKAVGGMSQLNPPVKYAAFELLPSDLSSLPGGDYFKSFSADLKEGKDPTKDSKTSKERQSLAEYLGKMGFGSAAQAEPYLKSMDAAMRAGMSVVGLLPPWSPDEMGLAMKAAAELKKGDPALLKQYADADPKSHAAASHALADYLRGTLGPEQAEKAVKLLDFAKDTGYDYKTFAGDPGKQFDDLTDAWRTSEMAFQIDKALSADPGGKSRMVVYSGGGHLGHDTDKLGGSNPEKSIGDDLPQYKSVVVGISGGDDLKISLDEPPITGSRAAEQAGLGHARFMYKYKEAGPRRVDYIIHLPEEG